MNLDLQYSYSFEYDFEEGKDISPHFVDSEWEDKGDDAEEYGAMTPCNHLAMLDSAPVPNVVILSDFQDDTDSKFLIDCKSSQFSFHHVLY